MCARERNQFQWRLSNFTLPKLSCIKFIKHIAKAFSNLLFTFFHICRYNIFIFNVIIYTILFVLFKYLIYIFISLDTHILLFPLSLSWGLGVALAHSLDQRLGHHMSSHLTLWWWTSDFTSYCVSIERYFRPAPCTIFFFVDSIWIYLEWW